MGDVEGEVATDMTQEEIIKEGYLTKSPPPGALKGWKKRWFVLRKTPEGGLLDYYADEKAWQSAQSPKGTIELETCGSVEKSMDDMDPEKQHFPLQLRAPDRVFTLIATSYEDLQAWIASIQLFLPSRESLQTTASASSKTASKRQSTSSANLVRSSTVSGSIISATHVGHRVTVWVAKGKYLLGTLRYVGPHHEDGFLCCGVELDKPAGRHGGTIGGHTYFECADNHGFVCSPLKVAINDQITAEDIGRSVQVWGYPGKGVMRFYGVHHADDTPRVGVVFETACGLNNGTIQGHKYFECAPKHGVLVHPVKVSFLEEDEPVEEEEFGFDDDEDDEEDPDDMEQNDDCVDAERVFAAGWMRKLGGGKGKPGRMEKSMFARKNWKTRWFVLRDDVLKYYRKKPKPGSTPKCLGTITIDEETMVRIDASNNLAFTVITPSRTYCMICKTYKDVQMWLTTLHEACNAAEFAM
eukprot:m.111059 g.111059  ORF g.111059 m.111059 type:complete len:469 (+) comp16096_c0_seq3:183-1589(+)